MKNFGLGLLAVCLALIVNANPRLPDKIFFDNSPMTGSYFYSEVTYTSPSFLKNRRHKLPVNDQQFFTPGNSLELNYVSAKTGNWQAGILFHPQRGINEFANAVSLTLRLYVQSKSTTKTDLPLIGIGNRKKEETLSFIPLQNYVSGLVYNQWISVKIPLDKFAFAADKKAIDQVVFKQNNTDGKEHALFIDQVELVPDYPQAALDIRPQIALATGYEKHVDISWKPVTDDNVKYVKIYRSVDGRSFYPVGVQLPIYNRYADFTGETGKTFYYLVSFLDHHYKETSRSNLAKATTRPMTDNELLDMVQEAHFRYYWEGAEPNSGLALENIPGKTNMIAAGASGFGIMAIIAATERRFITRQQAVERFDRITAFLEKAEKFHGAFPHFIDGVTGKVVPFFGQRDNGGDLVETSFLLQGLLTARQYFNGSHPQEKMIRERIDRIWKGVEWDWYRRYPDNNYLYWHWSPDKEWVINHQLIGWNETMMTYLLAIFSPFHPVPASMYYSGWASQDSIAQKYRANWGKTTDGSHYTNGNTYFGIPLPVGVSNGGPLFFIHYSFMGLDPHKMTDAYTSYFSNNKNIALINYRYCIENPENHYGYGMDAWGLTASDGLWGYSADEPVAHADHGKLTPTGALASFPYTPDEFDGRAKKLLPQLWPFFMGRIWL